MRAGVRHRLERQTQTNKDRAGDRPTRQTVERERLCCVGFQHLLLPNYYQRISLKVIARHDVCIKPQILFHRRRQMARCSSNNQPSPMYSVGAEGREGQKAGEGVGGIGGSGWWGGGGGW